MRLLRSASARLLAAHLALAALTTTLVFGFVYWQAGGVIDAEQRQVVEAELRDMADDYALGGPAALALAIERRIRDVDERDAVYLLTLPNGQRLAGNLADWPPTIAPGSGWSTLDLYRVGADEPTTISAVSLKLPRGERLLVGRDVAARAAFDATLARALGLALAAMLALSLVAGWLLSRLTLRRVDEVTRTAEAFMGGALDRRIALRGSGDEFDQLSAALNAMLDRIAALVGDLRMVTDSLAHDLRSPLGRLTRQLEAALDETAPPADRSARIAQALEEAEATLAISTGLLEISRIEAGLAAEQFESVDLAGVARDVAELYAASAEERGVTVETRIETTTPIDGHPQLLAQALSNLLDNALRYAPAGSTITVSVEARNGQLTLSVADQGPGVPEADRERVRQRFVRLDPSRGDQGAGLGLALVDAVARLHGARLTLEDNAPGLRAEIRFG